MLMIAVPYVGGSCRDKAPYIPMSHANRKCLRLKSVDKASTVNRNMPFHVRETG